MDINEMLASTASAQAQMNFQREMSNTAHRREVEDLKAAGLNPVLSAGGSGASTPEGASGDYSAVFGLLSQSMDNSAKAISSMGKTLESTIKQGLGKVDVTALQAMSDLKTALASGNSRDSGIEELKDKLENWFGKDTRIPNFITGKGTLKVSDLTGWIDGLIPSTPWQSASFWNMSHNDKGKTGKSAYSAKELSKRPKFRSSHGTF